MASWSSWLVAAMTRTSTWMALFSPSRRISPSWMARRSLAWKLGGVSAISSKKNVPPLASSKRPLRAATAPVKAPRAWPNSSLSRRVSLMAAQLTLTKGLSARFELAWIARATSSLPVPLSPVMSTVVSVGAMRTMRPSTSRTAAERPMMLSNL